jgi:H+-transporting ATPase
MTDAAIGLTTIDARALLQQQGANSMVEVAEHPLMRACKKLWAPVPWMLELAILIQIGLGDYPQAGVVGLLLLFNAGLGWFQEGRAQATLDALKSRLALVATARRDGIWKVLPAAELVPGDVLKLTLGAVVAADVRILDGSVLLDQSMLTGESMPVEAGAGATSYAGALVRRGEAIAVVSATGARTKFGKTAELVGAAKVESSQQKTVLDVVRNLVIFNGSVTVALAIYAYLLPLPVAQIIPLILIAVLASIPVALPSMFTLAAAVGARALALRGVLPTRLSAVDEAAGIDILCADKTGTLTANALTVMSVTPMPGWEQARILALAALCSAEAGQDPVDSAIRDAAAHSPWKDPPVLISFTPFDPALKRAEASVRQPDGTPIRVCKGAFSVIAALATVPADVSASADALEGKGYRVLAVAAGPEKQLKLVGLIALSDPPRADSAALIKTLTTLGVRTLMVTGDAQATAQVVATSVGIVGAAWSGTPLPDNLKAENYAIFAGGLPEDKFLLVKTLQKDGHIVGMCGDGANDAPALRQAQMGIAVCTATDVAKSAAGIVLTEPGLNGIVILINEGRKTFQRILTYTLRSIIHKVVQVLFLGVGLIMTGEATLTPTLMVLMMVTGDFLSMSSSTDNVRPSTTPNIWRIRNLTIAGIALGLADLLFCVACLASGKYLFGLDNASLRTFTVVTLVFSGQAVFYIARERKHLWSSMPGSWLLASSVLDLGIVCVLAINGVLMTALSGSIVAAIFAAAIVFAFILDFLKLLLFKRLVIA